jgi:hypothetical protein
MNIEVSLLQKDSDQTGPQKIPHISLSSFSSLLHPLFISLIVKISVFGV